MEVSTYVASFLTLIRSAGLCNLIFTSAFTVYFL